MHGTTWEIGNRHSYVGGRQTPNVIHGALGRNQQKQIRKVNYRREYYSLRAKLGKYSRSAISSSTCTVSTVTLPYK